MKPILRWAKQPTTLLAFAVIAAGVAYWFTRSAALAAGVAAAVLGGIDDHTQDVLARLEGLEDVVRPAVAAGPISALEKAATPASALVTALQPLAPASAHGAGNHAEQLSRP